MGRIIVLIFLTAILCIYITNEIPAVMTHDTPTIEKAGDKTINDINKLLQDVPFDILIEK